MSKSPIMSMTNDILSFLIESAQYSIDLLFIALVIILLLLAAVVAVMLNIVVLGIPFEIAHRGDIMGKIIGFIILIFYVGVFIRFNELLFGADFSKEIEQIQQILPFT